MDNIEQIQLAVSNKFKVEVSEEEIEAIITSQSRTTKWAIENDEDVYWIYFGKFKKKLGRVGALLKDEATRILIRTPFKPKSKELKKVGIGVRKDIVSQYGEGESIIKLD